MNIRSKIIISLALAFILINFLLALSGQDEVAVYFIFDAIAFLIIALVFSSFSPQFRPAMQYVSTLVFGGFIFFVAVKITEILK